jgi:hypothetical protein
MHICWYSRAEVKHSHLVLLACSLFGIAGRNRPHTIKVYIQQAPLTLRLDYLAIFITAYQSTAKEIIRDQLAKFLHSWLRDVF